MGNAIVSNFIGASAFGAARGFERGLFSAGAYDAAACTCVAYRAEGNQPLHGPTRAPHHGVRQASILMPVLPHGAPAPAGASGGITSSAAADWRRKMVPPSSPGRGRDGGVVLRPYLGTSRTPSRPPGTRALSVICRTNLLRASRLPEGLGLDGLLLRPPPPVWPSPPLRLRRSDGPTVRRSDGPAGRHCPARQ